MNCLSWIESIKLSKMSTGMKLFHNFILRKAFYNFVPIRISLVKTKNISFMYIYKFIQSANLWKFALDWQRFYFLTRLHFMYTQHMFTNVKHQSCCNFISFNIRISFKVNSVTLFPIFRKGMTVSFLLKGSFTFHIIKGRMWCWRE